MSDVIMDGVWIINVNPADKPLNIAACAVITMLIFGVIALFISFAVGEIDREERLIICISVAAGGFIYGTIIGAIYNWRLSPVTYDVMIGDNVSFNDFTEQYEIIEQNGNIYTVKERTK